MAEWRPSPVACFVLAALQKRLPAAAAAIGPLALGDAPFPDWLRARRAEFCALYRDPALGDAAAGLALEVAREYSAQLLESMYECFLLGLDEPAVYEGRARCGDFGFLAYDWVLYEQSVRQTVFRIACWLDGLALASAIVDRYRAKLVPISELAEVAAAAGRVDVLRLLRPEMGGWTAHCVYLAARAGQAGAVFYLLTDLAFGEALQGAKEGGHPELLAALEGWQEESPVKRSCN
jgi:hypothetical protein